MVNTKNILIIETDRALAQKQADALKEYGYYVLTAYTAQMAVEMIQQKPFIDLIIMDIDSLPDMSIFSITGQTREGEYIPVVCSSSCTSRDIITKIESVSPYGFVEKKAGDVSLAVSASTALRLSRSITKIRSQEALLAEAEAKYRTIVNNIESIIYTVNIDGVVTFVSTGWKKQLGHDVEEVIGRDFRPFVHRDDVSVCEDYLRRTLDTGQKQPEIEYRAVHKDGSIRWHRTNIIPVYDAQGNTAYLVGSAVDFTEKKRIEEELREANSAKDKFFSIIAHDLRGPMASLVRVFESVCRGELYFDHELLRAATESSRNIWNLLEDLLTWARSQKGQIVFNPVDISLDGLLKQSFDIHRMEASNKRIILTNERPESSLHIFADEAMVRTVMRNIISNAIKFTPENGRVSINAGLKGGFVDITVSDTGTGMPPELVSALFDIHNRRPSTPGTGNESGTGLGLILCREFVAANNGLISVQSTKGSGTVVTVSFPRGASPAVPAVKPEVLLERLKQLTFLLIEDNILHIKTTGMVLDGLSVKWEVAADGNSGLNKFIEGSHDIILMDINIPGINGIRLAEKIMGAAVKLPRIIALTSNPPEDFPLDAAGFYSYLHKPIDREKLLDILKFLTVK